MLGAEGVKTLVMKRLMAVLPKALEVRRHKVGCDKVELPDVQLFIPSPVVDVQVGLWPAITVSVDDTPGELSNVGPGPAQHGEVVQKYQLEYNVLVGINTWSADPSANGALYARLQAERIALGCREALLQKPLMKSGDDEYSDYAEVNYDRWIEEYASAPGGEEVGAQGWVGTALLRVPVLAQEFLDRSPYMDEGWYVLDRVDMYQADPVTGVHMLDTHRVVVEPPAASDTDPTVP